MERTRIFVWLCLVCAAAHMAMHAGHALARGSTSQQSLSGTPISDTGQHAVRSTSKHSADEGSYSVEPFVVDNAEVISVVTPSNRHGLGGKTQGWGHMGGLRRLLHGSRKPWQYSTCNACTLVRCSGSNCTGHCKKNRKLYFCSYTPRARVQCPPVKPGDVPNLEISPLNELDSVIVTATAPYIGCAEISKKPSGCPPRTTRGRTADGRRLVVLDSRCNAERYLPDCRGSPFFPFGTCECRIVVTGRRPEWGPCNQSLLDIKPASTANQLGAAVVEPKVVVESRGDVTFTVFGDNIEAEGGPDYSYNRTVAVEGKDALVQLQVFTVEVMDVKDEDLTEESEFSEDYDYGRVGGEYYYGVQGDDTNEYVSASEYQAVTVT